MKTIPILMYHSISSVAGRKFKQFTLTPAMFEAHLRYLSENCYTPLTVAQLGNVFQNGQDLLPERPVVITFDDGYCDFHESALPVLAKYSFMATLFIVTGYVEGSSRWLKPEGEENRKMLDWSQILEIDRAGIECGAHSHTHVDMDIAPADSVFQEMKRSKEILEQKLGHEVATLSYPYGHFTWKVRDLAKQAGFQAACAVRNAMCHLNDHRFSLARITIDNRTTVSQLAALLNGKGLRLATDEETLITKTWRQFRSIRQTLFS